jgi:chromosomal replication initiation ATPase DnaA
MTLESIRVIARSKSRAMHHVLARIAIAEILREEGISLKNIGAYLGGRDHTTILYYSQKASDYRWQKDRAYIATSAAIQQLRETILEDFQHYVYNVENLL